tara:strand:- start:1131 stop:1940 length:810 start_codon:yes stop_codon:yes gene_type:complete
MLVGRYYRNEDSIDTAKKLFLDAIKDNPYIKSPQAQLAYLYLDIEEFDSAYYYAKDAFNGIPNNNVHRDIFFKTLVQRKDTLELKESFELLLELAPNNSSHWLGYLDSRYQIVGPQDPEILELIPRFEDQFPDFDKRVVDGIKVIANSELQDLSFGASFAELGDNLFEEGDYLMAAQHYEIAISYAEYEYAFYENAAISYYLGERYDKAANYFTKVIDEFEINDGKSEFYLGILLIELDSINKGCDYLLKSSKLGFADGSTVAYNNFCN